MIKSYRSNFEETENGYKLEYVCPGFKKADISVLASNRLLDICAKNQKYSFSEKINLYNLIDYENISATLEDGILTIEIPKKESLLKTVNISVL